MKFKNRLEAARWMVGNPGKSVVFTRGDRPDSYRIWANMVDGVLNGFVGAWSEDDVINIRTADHKEPELEINWTEVSRVVFHDAPLYANILNTLQRYNYDLMKVLEAKFEAKK